MSVRYGDALIASSVVYGDPGHGVLGSVIRATTATGAHGPGLLYNDWDNASDDTKEFRALIVTPPASGALFVFEDGSFTLAGAADGSYTLTYRLFVDGADLGTTTATFTVGAYTPASDVTLNGWVAVGAATGAGAMADSSLSNYVESPDLGTPSIFAWSGAPLAAGTFDLQMGADRMGTIGQIRLVMLDGSNNVLGTSAWQTLSNSPTTYNFSVTTGSPASRLRLETQP